MVGRSERGVGGAAGPITLRGAVSLERGDELRWRLGEMSTVSCASSEERFRFARWGGSCGPTEGILDQNGTQAKTGKELRRDVEDQKKMHFTAENPADASRGNKFH